MTNATNWENLLSGTAEKHREEISQAIDNGEDATRLLIRKFMEDIAGKTEPIDFACHLVLDSDGNGTMTVPPQGLLDNEEIVYYDGHPQLKVMAVDKGEAMHLVSAIFGKYSFDIGFPLNMVIGELKEEGLIDVFF